MKKKIVTLCLILIAALGCEKSNDPEVFEKSSVEESAEPLNKPNNTYYVSATLGADSRTAAEAKNPATPWKTIQKAANTIPGGATVLISGGTYNEKVWIKRSCSGTLENRTVFKNKPGEVVIIDGGVINANANVTAGNNNNRYDANGGISQFKVDGAKFLTIKGIKVQNAQWYAISVENQADNTIIDSCSTFNSGASGIYVKTSNTIELKENNVQKACQITTRGGGGVIGTQECITLGTVNDFKVHHNEVSNSTVSGLAGGEGIDAKGGSANGEIYNNYVHDIVPLSIYIDAGSRGSSNIRVYNNKILRADGFAVAGELGGHADKIYFYNNIIRECRRSAFVFNIPGEDLNGVANELVGKYTNIYVVNNTFYNNAQTSGFVGEIVSYSENPTNNNLVIKNNIIHNKGTNAKFSIRFNQTTPFFIAGNLFYDFIPAFNGANSYTTANLTSADVLNLDPQFVNPATNNLALQPGSPAINKGVAITLPGSAELMFTTDINGKSRGTSNWDFGAYEF